MCETLGAYLEALAGIGAGRVPLLAPGEPRRRARWLEILAWYGLEQESSPLALLDPGALEDAWIVAVDRELVELGEGFARARGRPFHDASGGWDARSFCHAHAPASVWILGLGPSFTYAALHSLEAGLECPWGLLPARDLPGLSFALAKSVARAPRGPTTLIDALHGRFAKTLVEASEPERSALAAAAMATELRARDHARLVICAHGEGSHMYLVSAVLCGLVGERERGLDGSELEGCHALPDAQRHCKRVPGGELEVVGHAELKAAELALLTGSGLNVAGQQYPSSSSSVLAALEGYARSVLTTADFCDYGPWVGPALHALLAAGRAPSEVAWLLDEVLERRVGQRPLVFAGDPVGARGEREALPDPLVLTPCARPRVFELAGAELPEVLGCEPPLCTLLRGARALIELPHPRTRGRDVVLSEAGPRLAESEALGRWLGARLDEAAAFERALRAAFVPAIPAAGEALERITSARGQVELGLRELLGLSEDTRRHGVWRPRLDALRTTLFDRVDVWDAGVAELLGTHLLHRPVDAALMQTARVINDWPGRGCERCATPMRRTLAEHARGLPALERWQCPNCEVMTLHARGGVSPGVTLAPELTRAQPCVIEVAAADGEGTALESICEASMRGAVGHRGRLTLALIDKGRGELMFTWTGTIASTRRFEFEVPEVSSPTLHMFRLAWVRAMRVSLVRRRSVGRLA